LYFDKEAMRRLSDVVLRYRSHVGKQFGRLLNEVAPGYEPPTLRDYIKALDRLRADIENARELIDLFGKGGENINDTHAPLLRTAVAWFRLATAEDVDARREKAIHPELFARFDEELHPFDELVAAKWFEETKACAAPQLSDFFPIAAIDEQLAEGEDAEAREYDEKFHILQAPRLFLRDLQRARMAAAFRGIRVAAAYLDIDKFKDFNTEKGEPYVDRHVLPFFMRRLEAHVYARGYAYRYGGDEYCVLLNNVSEQEALSSMERLRCSLADLTYEGTSRRTTVSIGVVLVYPDSYSTGKEIEQAAAAAKKYAKDNGRNCVATYSGASLREDHLRVVTPPSAHPDPA
jgi:diguanylate cyclase (GGDEF)-like protein